FWVLRLSSERRSGGAQRIRAEIPSRSYPKGVQPVTIRKARNKPAPLSIVQHYLKL
ncbi:hypothetical protein COCVIDRAFT_113603, partial [Bipolaris victoriae FI3]